MDKTLVKAQPFRHLHNILRFYFLYYFFVLLVLPYSIKAQQKNIPLNREWGLKLESLWTTDATFNHQNDSFAFLTTFRPIIENNAFTWNQYRNANSIDFWNPQNTLVNRKKFSRKIRREDLIFIKDSANNKYRFGINPLLNFEYGNEQNDTISQRLYKNTRGIHVWGDIGSDFSFESSFYENQAVFPGYVKEFADTYKVIPGQGRWKKFKNKGYDFAMATGYISYSPAKHINFQLGHGKHMVGDGYRSLLLSDNSFSYPFFRITTNYKNFRYTNLYSMLMNFSSGGAKTPPNTEPLFQKKAASFQLLEFSALKRINIGLFQGMIWKSSDTLNQQKINIHYFNPLLFANAAQFGLGSTNNILLGATIKIKVLKNLFLYSQFAVDEIAKDFKRGVINNKQGIQVGIKYLEPFKIKRLFFQTEFNQVRPYTYSHKKPEQSYSHYNQALAHPLGANFKEIVGILNYQHKWFFLELKINRSVIGTDSIGVFYGNTIFNSDNLAVYGVNSTINHMGQGIKTTTTNLSIQIGHLINPAYNLNIAAGITQREKETNLKTEKTLIFFIALRTSLTNNYYDF